MTSLLFPSRYAVYYSNAPAIQLNSTQLTEWMVFQEFTWTVAKRTKTNINLNAWNLLTLIFFPFHSSSYSIFHFYPSSLWSHSPWMKKDKNAKMLNDTFSTKSFTFRTHYLLFSQCTCSSIEIVSSIVVLASSSSSSSSSVLVAASAINCRNSKNGTTQQQHRLLFCYIRSTFLVEWMNACASVCELDGGVIVIPPFRGR